MATRLCGGPIFLAGSRDDDGNRTWNMLQQVDSDVGDGPANVLRTPGLPLPGDPWIIQGDVDVWAFCGLKASVSPQNGPPVTIWHVEIPFTTKTSTKSCKDKDIEDPLLLPPKVSGNFNRITTQATRDRFGRLIKTSSHEQILGPPTEFDDDRIQIEVEMNTAILDLGFMALFRNAVNAFTIWGFPPRTLKCTLGPWSQHFYGQCHSYYTKKFSFEYNDLTWDRVVPDEGVKVLRGRWNSLGDQWIRLPVGDSPLNPDLNGTLNTGAPKNPDPDNPAHFIRYQDQHAQLAKVQLDGFGLPYNPTPLDVTDSCDQCPDGSPAFWTVTGFNRKEPTMTQVIEQDVGSCDWVVTGTTVNADLVLEFDSTGQVWLLTDNGSGAKWSTDIARWRCMGPNTMLLADPGTPGPNYHEAGRRVTLASGTSTPGSILIQYYPEIDFYLLGLPTIV